MAQKPVPNALILELEPVVDENLNRHLESEDIWFAHDYVPFEQGQNFAFLGGQDWDPAQVTLPKHVTDALEILLIQKDNLAAYHREFVFSFILEEKWGRWLGRWTAEEHLHAIALRNYLVVTREVDPAANEDVRVEHVMKGYRADTYSQIERLVFMAFYERAYAVYCRNLEAQITEPVLNGLVGRIARDEERHEEFFRKPRRASAGIQPRGDHRGHREPRRRTRRRRRRHRRLPDKVRNVADAGIFDDATLRQVISDRITAWGLADEPRLRPSSRRLSCWAVNPARLHATLAFSGVASFAMASDMLCCPGGTDRFDSKGPAPALVPQCPPRGSCGAARARGALRDRFLRPDLRSRHIRVAVRPMGLYTVCRARSGRPAGRHQRAGG